MKVADRSGPGASTGCDISHHFAAMASNVVVADLDPRSATAAKMSILDTIGVAFAASGVEPAVRAAVGLAESDGGREEATVWAHRRRLPATTAAFANGALAHGLDYDDQTPWGQHASSSVVPAVLAVGERRGGVSGADLVAAVAAGQDLFARLRCHVGWRKDWNLSSTLGVYAAAAAASRVLGLSARTTQHALGIASQQSAGVMEAVAGTGSDLRGLYAGFSARGAVTSALLADRGLTGPDRVFEGDAGVFHAYFGGEYDRDGILAGIGADFRGGGTLYKLWPAVGTAHSHIHATARAMTDAALAPEDIAEIRVFVGDYHRLMCTPLAVRRAPETLVDAKFSLPFLVALAAVHGTVRMTDFTADGLRDRRIRDMAAKVVPVDDPSLDWRLDLPPGRVEIRTLDGRIVARSGAGYPGGPEAPATWEEVAGKFRDCAAHAVSPLPPDRIEAIIALARDLESLSDSGELTRQLS